MLSLRRFSAVASSRLSTRVIRPSITALPSIASTIRASFVPSISRIAVANFSVSRTRFDEHSQYLVAKLAKEIELETEETAAGSGSEAGVKQFFDEVPGWEVTDLEGEQDVLFTRKYEDEEITVHFNIADFNSVLPSEEHGMEDDVLADEEDMDLQSGGANTKGSSVQGRTSGGNYKVAPEDSEDAAAREESYDEDDAPPAFPVNVTVLIHRPAAGDKGSLRFDLVSDNGEFNIQQITPLASSSASALEQVRESYSDRQTRYAGPPFEQLDESVQETFEEYLNARGITSQLANVIPDYIDVKEQKEYLAWLNRVRSFAE